MVQAPRLSFVLETDGTGRDNCSSSTAQAATASRMVAAAGLG